MAGRYRWKMLLLWIFHLLQQLHGFQHCLISENNTLVSPCSNCSKKKSNIQHVKGFEEVNVSIQGCFSTGKWSRDDVQGVSVYKETHVINVVNGSINKVFLAIKDTTLPQSVYASARPLYSFVLLSTSPIEWLISYNGSAVYDFYTTVHSAVKERETRQTILSRPAGFSTTMESGLRYHPAQIKYKVCSKTFRITACHITSFLQVQNLDIMELIVGNANDSDEKEDVCSPLTSFGKVQDNRVKALLVSSASPLEACSEKIGADYLYVVGLANLSRDATVYLELNGLSLLEDFAAVHVILHSTMPVVWRCYDSMGNDISVHINFMVSGGSDVDMSELTFSNTKGGATKKIFSHLLAEGNTLLDTVRQLFDIPITSYAVFDKQPRIVKILFYDNDVTTTWKPVKKISQDLLLILQMGMRITAWGSQLRVSNVMMKKFDLEASDIVVGDGSCTYYTDESNVVYGDLVKCGLNRISIDAFNINVTVKDQIGVVWHRLPNKTPKLKILQAFNKEISYPQDVGDRVDFFLIQVSGASNQKYGVYSKLERCYLNSVNSSARRMLIEDSLPANQFISVLTPYEVSPDIRFKSFLLQLHARDMLEASHLYNVTCAISPCFTPENISQFSDLLPLCSDDLQVLLDSSQKLNHREKYTEIVAVNAFICTSTNATGFSSTSLNATTTSSEWLSSVPVQTESVFGNRAALYIASFAAGLVVGALLIAVAVNLVCVKRLKMKKIPAYSSAKLKQNGIIKTDKKECVELLETNLVKRDDDLLDERLNYRYLRHGAPIINNHLHRGNGRVPTALSSCENSRESKTKQSSDAPVPYETNHVTSNPNSINCQAIATSNTQAK